jgi:hypothetical protein
MRKLTQPWKLCRSVGSQPVGNVAGPRWTEAGIAAQELPPQSSCSTFSTDQATTVYPVVNDCSGSFQPNLIRRKLGDTLKPQIQDSKFGCRRTERTRKDLPRSSNQPIVSFGVVFQNHLVTGTPFSPLEVAKNPFLRVGFHSSKFLFRRKTLI